MTDDNQTNDKKPAKKTTKVTKKTPAKVIAKAPEDKEFPKLKKLTHQEMYDLVGKFVQKAIPIKGAKLTVVKGMNSRVSAPKTPCVILQVIKKDRLSSTETRYTDKHKILWYRSMVTMSMLFMGGGNISALEMGHAFEARFNDSWAADQFEKLSDILFPLYSDDVKIEEDYINNEDQYEDSCSVDVYFEYHPEVGVCEESSKEIIMNTLIADSEEDSQDE